MITSSKRNSTGDWACHYCLFMYLTTVCQLQSRILWWLLMINWKGFRRKQLRCIVVYYPSIFLHEQRKTTEDFHRDKQPPAEVWMSDQIPLLDTILRQFHPSPILTMHFPEIHRPLSSNKQLSRGFSIKIL